LRREVASESHSIRLASSSGEGVLWLFDSNYLLLLSSLGVELHKLGKIELRLLEDLDLLDENILKWEDLGAFLGDSLSNLVADELLEEILEGRLLSSVYHDFLHFGADELLLRIFGVAGGLYLSLMASGECDAEHSDEVAVLGLCLNEGFNGGVPLLDESAELVSGDIDAIEVSIAVEALDLLDLYADLSPGLLMSITVQVSK